MDAFILWFQFCCPIPAAPLATLARMRAKQLSKASTALVIWLCACVRYRSSFSYTGALTQDTKLSLTPPSSNINIKH